MPNKPPVIILIVSTSFGEIDWILPVLVRFKERHPEWEIITLFSHQLLHQYVVENRSLYAEFRQVSSLDIVPQELDLLFTQRIATDQVRIILKDYNQDQYAPYKTEVMARCPQALVVSYPHSNHIYSNRVTDPLQSCANPDEYSKHDFFLLCSANDTPYWSRYVDTARIRAFGYPRYDSWWVERFLNSPSFQDSVEYQTARQADKVFFYISRGEHRHYLNLEDYQYLVRSTLENVLRHDNSLLIIKPHPRQDIADLRALLRPYDPGRWLISGLHLFQLASLADVVISGWSSGILDALAVGKPVIEFWRFGGRDPLGRKRADGRFTTIYRELGLAAAAETSAELGALLISALDNPHAGPWQGQLDAFQRHCHTTDTASQEVADCLFAEACRKFAAATAPLPSPGTDSELIDTLSGYIVTLVEHNELERVRQWLDFLAVQFPNQPKIFNIMGVFLFNQGEFTDAVDNLVKALNLDPHYGEAAINLTQILLGLERVDDALALVVGHYRRCADEPARSAFLHAMRRELDDASFDLIRAGLATLRDQTP